MIRGASDPGSPVKVDRRDCVVMADLCRSVYGRNRPKAGAVLTKLSDWRAGHARGSWL